MAGRARHTHHARVASCIRQIEMPLDALKTVFDSNHAFFHPSHTLFHAIEPRVLDRDLSVHMGHLSLQMRHVHFEARHAHREVGDIGSHLLNGLLEHILAAPKIILAAPDIILAAPEKMKLLHNEIGGFVDHGSILTAFLPLATANRSQSHRSFNAKANHNASAPEMISISSLVIIAWRVRL
jgi:hypothetical protein